VSATVQRHKESGPCHWHDRRQALTAADFEIYSELGEDEKTASRICRECSLKLIKALSAMLVLGDTKESRASKKALKEFFK
jgi:hypothetical protein